jgi:hypothetical protein
MRIRLLVAFVTTAAALPASAAARNLTRARDAAVRWAVAQDGLHERGTSNRGPQIDRWERAMGVRIGQPWCGAYVHQAYLRAGIRLSARLIDPERSYRDAQANRRGLRAIPIRSVRRGDLLFFAFRPGLLASHFALVRGRPRDGRVATAEGNVAHAVRLQVRGLAYPVLAARVTG